MKRFLLMASAVILLASWSALADNPEQKPNRFYCSTSYCIYSMLPGQPDNAAFTTPCGMYVRIDWLRDGSVRVAEPGFEYHEGSRSCIERVVESPSEGGTRNLIPADIQVTYIYELVDGDGPEPMMVLRDRFVNDGSEYMEVSHVREGEASGG